MSKKTIEKTISPEMEAIGSTLVGARLDVTIVSAWMMVDPRTVRRWFSGAATPRKADMHRLYGLHDKVVSALSVGTLPAKDASFAGVVAAIEAAGK